MSCVYLHAKPGGAPFYIGIGQQKGRAYDHSSRSDFWYHIVEKYGDPEVAILHDNISWEEACLLEMFYISLIGRRDLNLGTLVNLTSGGEGAHEWRTPEARSRINSIAAKKNYSPEKAQQLREGAQKKWKKMTAEERKKRAKLTSTQRTELARKMNNSMTTSQISSRNAKGWKNLSAEQRSEKIKRAWKTRKEKKNEN